MDEPAFSPLPALEEGLSPLDQLTRVPRLNDDAYPRARALLLLHLAWACVDASRCVHTPKEAGQVALLRRADLRSSLTFSGLENQIPAGDRPILHGFLAVQLLAALAARLPDTPLRRAIDFTAPDSQDIVYRLAHALPDPDRAQALLGGAMEIMPGRPLIACHRHPFDGIGAPMAAEEDPLLPLAAMALTAVSTGFCQHLIAAPAPDEQTRGLYVECAMICEQHATLFASMLPLHSPGERLLLAEDTLAYLALSCAQAEENADLRALYYREAAHALAHGQKLRALLRAREENAPPRPMRLPPLILAPCKGYVRDTLKQIGVTARRDQFVPVGSLPRGADFFRYQKRICPRAESVPSHAAVQRFIDRHGVDCRFEIAPHPIQALRDRSKDQTNIGR
ncbi:MAG: hypothetical protein IJ662_05010 [Clostridia bacterium]|nr:hypothetical protein [Clostridia bacterium]